MSSFKTTFWLTVLATILIIGLPTILKITKNHEERMYLVATKKILESAEACFYDDVCQDSMISLGDLKQKGYLDDVIDPQTKTYFEDDLMLVYENYRVSFKSDKS
ncbi:MAG: hypothetical protein HFI09_04555 [Bacilli bacterium]|nr:hypothetical protein [Bacilli bacterium]